MLIIGNVSLLVLEKLARYFGNLKLHGFVIILSGDLGSGKTTFVRFLLHSVGVQGAIRSPTFLLIEGYELSCLKVYHIDCYNLCKPVQLVLVNDCIADDSICLIEWGERVMPALDRVDLQIKFDIIDQDNRSVSIIDVNDSYPSLMQSLEDDFICE